jgi:hypothetical protein
VCYGSVLPSSRSKRCCFFLFLIVLFILFFQGGLFAATAAQVGELGLQFLLTGLVKKVILGDDISRPMTDGETMGAALLGGLYWMIWVNVS